MGRKSFAGVVLSVVSVLLFCSRVTWAQMDITTWQVNTSHTGVNPTEQILTPQFVSGSGNITCLFAEQVDGQMNAQPLYLTMATSNKLPGAFPDGAPHNAVYVATQNGTIYAIDGDRTADGCNKTNTNYLWQAPLASLPGGPTPNGTPEYYTDIMGAADISPLLGLTETPVIDPATGTLYAVATIKDTNTTDAANTPSLGLTPNTPFVQLLYALDIKTGNVKGWTVINPEFNGDYTTPACASGTTCDIVNAPAGKIPFVPEHQHLRSSMIFDSAHSTVWLAYASHNDQTPYWGLVLGYNVSNPASMSLNASFNTTPVGGFQESGIWMGGASPALDPTTSELFVMTGNGDWDQKTSQNTRNTNWGMSVLRLSSDPTKTVLTNGVPEMQLSYANDPTGINWFTPSQWNTFNNGDHDLGSGGLLLLPPIVGPSNETRNLMIGGGKAGVMYVLDRTQLGGMAVNDTSASNPNAVQQIIEGVNTNEIFNTPTYFNGNIYYSASAALNSRAFVYNPNSTPPTYVSASESKSAQGQFFDSATNFISASSPTTGGIVWEVSNGLYAWDATNIQNTIYTASASVPTGGRCITSTWAIPIVDNGKVYFGCYAQPQGNQPSNNTNGYLFVYGPASTTVGAPTSEPMSLTATANSSTQITLTWTYSGTGNTSFAVNRSTDGVNYSSITPSAPLSSNATTYIDGSVLPNTTYYYTVQATNGNGPSQSSNAVHATTFSEYEEPNLVAYWPLDEGVSNPSANQAFDATGRGHTAAYTTGESNAQADGLINGAWFWHGGNQYDALTVADAPDLDFTSTQSFTLATWANINQIPGYEGGVRPGESALIVKSADQGNEYGLFINGAGNWVARGPSGDLVGPAAVEGAWTHVALVQDGVKGTRTLYINGVASANTAPAQNANGAGQLWFGDENALLPSGAQDTESLEGMKGNLDEIRLYNAALTQSQIKDLMGDPVISAISILPSGTQTFGVPLFPSPVPLTEPRVPSNETYTIQVKFAAPLQNAPAVALQSQTGGAANGSVSGTTIDSTGTLVTVTLTAVTNAQALNLHFTNLNSNLLSNESQDVPFNILYGDVSQDHEVNSIDGNAIQAAYSGTVTPQNAFFDLNGDGVINGNDLALQQTYASVSFPGSGDTNLAFFKPAFASSTNGGNVPANAFDNNLNDNWETVHPPNGNANSGVAGVDPGWIYMDLGTAASVDGFTIQWAGSGAAVYTIDACTGTVNSTSGVCSAGWQNMVTENHGGNLELKSYTGLTPVTAEFFRMNGTVRVNAPYGYQINEFYVYGSYNPSNTPPPNPPAAPVVNQPTAISGQVSLNWSASSGATSYSVFRGTSAGGESTTAIATTSTTSYVDSAVVNGTKYYYYVKATGTGGASGPSNEVNATPPVAAQSAPVVNPPTATSGQVSLSWSASSGATSYSVFRGTTAGGESTTAIATPTTTSYVDTAVVNGTKYYYYVKAMGTGGTSAPSNEVNATPPVTAQSAPVVSTPTATSGQVSLSWSASSGATSYSVFRGTSAGGESTTAIAAPTTTSYVDTAVVNGTTYYYYVKATGTGGTSGPSNEVKATPQASSTTASDVIAVDCGVATAVTAPNGNVFLGETPYVSGGGTYDPNQTITIPAAIAGIAAPQLVYQSAHQGTMTYTFPNLAVGATYTVVLHFAELWFTTAQSRQFDVAINGSPVPALQNFDIVANAGAGLTAVVKTVPNIVATAGANGSGQIVVAFTNGAANQPMVNGIEIQGSSSGTTSPPPAPVVNQPTATSSQVSLSWGASTGATSYSVFRGTAAGSESTTALGTSTTASYVDNKNMVNGTTYYYYVEAIGSGGASGKSNEVSATIPASGTTPADVIAVDAGSATAVTSTSGNTFRAETAYVTGGNTYAPNPTITIPSALQSVAAPAQVYQTAHQGSPVTFTLPGFVANSTGHTVVLHFAELYFSAPMQRIFNIQIGTVAGGMQVVSDFDIYAAASAYLPAGSNAKDTAVVEMYSNITADQNGNITVIFSGGNSGNVDQPMINGIEAR